MRPITSGNHPFVYSGFSQPSLDEQVAFAQEIAVDLGGQKFLHATALEERNRLWESRHHAWYGQDQSYYRLPLNIRERKIFQNLKGFTEYAHFDIFLLLQVVFHSVPGA